MAVVLAALLQGDPAIDALVYLARHAERRNCGCAPARPGDLGRVVLAFLACGYTPLSQDAYEGEHLGETCRRLVARIAVGQRDDGLFFPDDPTANAWMAYAMTELYGMIGSPRYEDPARRAAEAIQGMPANDPEARFWQLIVLRSAETGGLLPKSPTLSSAGSEETPLGLARTDHRFVMNRGHDRKEHQAWKKPAAAPWAARQIREGCGAGSWGHSVESTSYLAPLFGRRCHPCRLLGVRGEKE